MSRNRFPRLLGNGAVALVLAAGAGGLTRPENTSSQWREVAPVYVRGTSVTMIGISAPAADNAWAMAEVIHLDFLETVKPLLDHWNGARWRNIRLPKRILAYFGGGDLWNAFGAAPDGAVWAFTGYGKYLRLSGGHWSAGLLPFGSNRVIEAAKVFSRANVWVFGATIGPGVSPKQWPFAARFNGRRWTVVHVPGTGDINAVSAESPRDMYVVTGLVAGTAPRVLHWNGRTWRELPRPLFDRSTGFWTVLAQGKSGLFVGGAIAHGQEETAAMVERWNGRSWTDVSPRPAPTGASEFVLSLAPDNDGGIWAVAAGLESDAAQIFHREHGAWSRPAYVRLPVDQLTAIPGTRSTWASGTDESGYDLRGVIVLHGPTP